MWDDIDLLTLHGYDPSSYARSVVKHIFSISFLEKHVFQDIGAPVRFHTNRMIFPSKDKPEHIEVYNLIKSK